MTHSSSPDETDRAAIKEIFDGQADFTASFMTSLPRIRT
jgi:hypothetical protein